MTVKDADATSTGSDEAATAEPTLDRRGFMVLGAGGLLAAVLQSARPAAAQSAQRRGTLVIALDISDATGLDPVRVYQYSNPLPTHAAYDGMVTFDPGDSVNLKPALATEWAYQPDGKTVRLKLRTDVKFASGKPMTAEDVRFSFTRQLNIKDQPWQYISHIEEVKVVDAAHGGHRAEGPVAAVDDHHRHPGLRRAGEGGGGRPWRHRCAGRQGEGQGDRLAEREFRRHRARTG